jgi:NADH-quinone oxidoreductase subunit C
MDEDFIHALLKKNAFLSKRESLDILTLDCPSDNYRDLIRSFRDEEGFELLADLTAIDHGEDAEIRFSIVVHLYSLVKRGYLRVHVSCSDNEHPFVPTVSDLFPAANWHERETYDMFGIIFSNHPDLRRILMWDEYPHFPLRKEFPLAGIDTPLPAADVVEVTNASVEPAPMMGGPFVSSGDGVMSESEPRARDESWTEQNEKS